MDELTRRSLDQVPLRRLLAIAAHVGSQRWSRVMSQQHGLTASGAGVLLALAPGDDGVPRRATNNDLARRLWIRPASLTGIVDNLARAGLVTRARDELDRRQVWITLTPAGVERSRQISGQMHRTIPPAEAERDPAKAAIVREYLTELITLYQNEEADLGESGDLRPGARRGSA